MWLLQGKSPNVTDNLYIPKVSKEDEFNCVIMQGGKSRKEVSSDSEEEKRRRRRDEKKKGKPGYKSRHRYTW